MSSHYTTQKRVLGLLSLTSIYAWILTIIFCGNLKEANIFCELDSQVWGLYPPLVESTSLRKENLHQTWIYRQTPILFIWNPEIVAQSFMFLSLYPYSIEKVIFSFKMRFQAGFLFVCAEMQRMGFKYITMGFVSYRKL